MATPSKAFIDPTYLSRKAVRFESVVANIAMPKFCPVAPIIRLFDEVTHIPLPALQTVRMVRTDTPRVPEPPMGRQLLVTFPSHYKERGAAKGQLWPLKV